MEANNTIHILLLLVDDHPVVRTGYRMILNNTTDIKVVGEAGSAKEAYTKYNQISCDVIIMDLSMPDVSGIDAIKKIHIRDSNARILALSMHEEMIFVEQALKAGATGYITKRSDPGVLIEAIRSVASGKTYIIPEIANLLVSNHIRREKSELSNLSPREFSIFCLIAEGLDINRIGERMALSAKTVANYSTQNKAKLNCKTNADIARLAINNQIINP